MTYYTQYTYAPLDVCSRRVTRVEAPGHRQLLANRAYLNSSSHTTCSENSGQSVYTWACCFSKWCKDMWCRKHLHHKCQNVTWCLDCRCKQQGIKRGQLAQAKVQGMKNPSVLTSKFDMELVLRSEDLDILGTMGGKILHCPWSQYSVLILEQREKLCSATVHSATGSYSLSFEWQAMLMSSQTAMEFSLCVLLLIIMWRTITKTMTHGCCPFRVVPGCNHEAGLCILHPVVNKQCRWQWTQGKKSASPYCSV